MKETIKVTKLESALAQTKTAIFTYFRDKDPVSVLTLSGAAHQVLTDLLKHKGKEGALEEGLKKYIKPEKQKELRGKMREAQTFIKHSEREKSPNDEVELCPFISEFYLFESCVLLQGYGYTSDTHLNSYIAWFSCKYPHLFNGTTILEIKQLQLLVAPDLSKKTIFEFLNSPLLIKQIEEGYNADND